MIVLSLYDKILRFFGTSEQQLRWKRHIRDRQREDGRRGRNNRNRHLKYQHKVCPECGSVNDRNAASCAVCEAKLPSWRAAQAEKWIARLTPGVGAMTAALLAINGVIFLLMVLDTGSVWGPNGLQSIAWGANYGPLLTGGGEWWRLVTGAFIHGGLLHVGFNLFALAQIGPLVEQFYGTARATTIYLGTAVLASVASHLWNPMGVSIGASGAIMGLVGAGVVAGHLRGGQMGHAVRNALLKWVVFIALFGLLVPNIDNAAHFGGFAAGAILGLGLRQDREAGQRGRWIVRGVAGALVLVSVLALLLGGVSVTGQPRDLSEAGFNRAVHGCGEAVEALGLPEVLVTRPRWPAMPDRLAGGADLRPAAELCDKAAKLAMFYSEPSLTILAANLWRQVGEVRRAERLEAILQASGYRIVEGDR